MKNAIYTAIFSFVAVGSWFTMSSNNEPSTPETETTPDGDFIVDENTSLWKVMTKLGKIKTNPLDSNVRFSADKGKELLDRGFTTDFNGKVTPKLNKRLTCSACHAHRPEHFSAVTIDPKQRLLYSDSMHTPFLPGAPLYGVVNRISFFNDDFQTMYRGEYASKFKKAHLEGLRAAIRVCNETYGQGRKMEDWEVESILAYFWSTELRLGDLKLDPMDMAKVELAVKTDKDNARAVNILRRYYQEVYPSHLSAPLAPEARRKTSPMLNSFTNGWRVYRWSCLHCHQDRRYSDFRLDINEASFKVLKKNFEEDSKYSIYDVIRYHPESKGNATGMPLYTTERMSDQQIQDLRFFIIQMANMGNEAFDYFRGR